MIANHDSCRRRRSDVHIEDQGHREAARRLGGVRALFRGRAGRNAEGGAGARHLRSQQPANRPAGYRPGDEGRPGAGVDSNGRLRLARADGSDRARPSGWNRRGAWRDRRSRRGSPRSFGGANAGSSQPPPRRGCRERAQEQRDGRPRWPVSGSARPVMTGGGAAVDDRCSRATATARRSAAIVDRGIVAVVGVSAERLHDNRIELARNGSIGSARRQRTRRRGMTRQHLEQDGAERHDVRAILGRGRGRRRPRGRWSTRSARNPESSPVPSA